MDNEKDGLGFLPPQRGNLKWLNNDTKEVGFVPDPNGNITIHHSPTESSKMLFLDMSLDTSEYQGEPNVMYVGETSPAFNTDMLQKRIDELKSQPIMNDTKKFTITELEEIVNELMEEFTVEDKKFVFFLKSSDLASLRTTVTGAKYVTRQSEDLFGNHVMMSTTWLYQGFTIEATYTSYNMQRMVFAGTENNKYCAFKHLNYVTFNSNSRQVMIILPEFS